MLSIKHKVINKKSCLAMIEGIKDAKKSEFEKIVNDMFIGKTVQANYGKYAFHRIDDISFDKNVNNTSVRRKSI